MKHKHHYLDYIQTPKDVKKLSITKMQCLASEVRKFLIQSVAETGGHLASNLGVVELTIAMHYCFSLPDDKIIWDVGHQAYVHKILSGRREQFNSLRKLNGISGFPKTKESIYDSFDTGHSSTSVSAAFGMASARDLRGEDYNIVAVIGDGSMTGGLAYEALNNAGRTNTNLLVILNDNQMSISENVGAMSRHLNEIRTAPYYLGAKEDVHRFLDRIPVIGKKIGRFIERTKDGIKYLFLPGVLFEELGFTYIGPVDGHALSDLIRVMNKCKQISGPVLLHVYTQKGRGYRKAETRPEFYHGVDCFDIKTGRLIKQKSHDTYSDIFGESIVALAKENDKIVAITASMVVGTGLSKFWETFPNRSFDVGIAESHAVTFAAGLAISGLIPVFAVYSSFLQRAYDQILHDVCLQNLPVIFAIDRAGIVGADGETHQGVFDLSFLSHMPNMTILAPRNGSELSKMLAFAVELGTPVAIRYPRGGFKEAHKSMLNIVYGKAETIDEGEEIAVISVGTMMEIAEAACNALKQLGKKPLLVNARFVKPIDNGLIEKIACFSHVFTLEDNCLSGGFGSSLLDVFSEKQIFSVKTHCFAFPDQFIKQGTRDELFRIYGLDEKGVVTKIMKILGED